MGVCEDQWMHARSPVNLQSIHGKKGCLYLLRQVTIMVPLGLMHPLDVGFVVLPAKWCLEELDAFRTTMLPSWLLKIFLLPKHLTESTSHSNDSSTVASRMLTYTEPELSNVVVLERRFALLRHCRTRNWATTTYSACVLNNDSRVAGATCLCSDTFKFGATQN